MKKSILIVTLLIAGLSFNSFAQPQKAKADTAKKQTAPVVPAKPEYKPDPAKVYHITLDISGPEIFSVTSALEGTLHRNSQLSGAQIGEMEDVNKAFSKAIKAQAETQANIDFKKWQSDTTVQSKLLIKPHKN